MSAKKSAAKSSPGVAPRAVSTPGEPIGRLARILGEARDKGLAIEPYEICEGLTLYPPRKDQLEAMDQYSTSHLLAQSSVFSLVRTQGEPPPPEDHEGRALWSQQRQKELEACYKLSEDALTGYNVALFGGEEKAQQVDEFFATREDWERKVFEKDIKEQFLKLPVDGTCQACGGTCRNCGGEIKPAGEPSGESGGESSGGSSISGTSSTGTSPDTSTASTSTTGSEEPGAGPSSSTTAGSSPE